MSVLWKQRAAAAACATGVTALACAASGSATTLFLIRGGGWGHGVGMSQWGAEGYAQHGWNDRRILAHYYPHTTLTLVHAPTTIRVLLAQQRFVSIGSNRPFLVVDANGTRVHVPARTLQFGVALRLGKTQLVAPVQIQPGAAVLTFDGKGYRGNLTLVKRPGALSVVNDVSLQPYLRGVVPSEMPRLWLPAAYEVQAIAARSYALAARRGTGYFDLYADTRDQMYGGIDAETPQTNAAVGYTAGQVLTYEGKPILAFYSASTGGRTEAVQAAFPGRAPVPYLVSVSDPYDTISPVHRWHLVLAFGSFTHDLGFTTTDVVEQRDPAGHALSVELSGPRGTKTVTGDAFAQTLGLRSSRFSVAELSLVAPFGFAAFGKPYTLTGFARGATDVSLEKLTPNDGWQLARRVRLGSDGDFAVTIRPRLSTEYRLALGRLAGPVVSLSVQPELSLRASGNVVSGTIRPSVPLQVEQEVGASWHVVAQVPVSRSGSFRTTLRTGRYRLTSSPAPNLSPAVSPSVIIVS
jgi:stage II sporulation protein D